MQHKVHKRLSNGQTASIYFRLDRNQRFTDGYYYDCWYVAFVVGDHRSLNNRWWAGHSKLYDDKSTGRCGVEGLMWAKKELLAFMDARSSDVYQWVVLDPTDDRRGRAYSRLKKDGFLPGVYDEANVLMKRF